jgi:hypothetical protein
MYEGKTAAEWRAEAQACRAKKEESFQRCDTDGFLTQWADGITASLYGMKATLAESNGMSEFPGLFVRATGERVRAKLINGSYGWCWALVDDRDEFTGTFYGDSRTKRAKLYKAGYEVRMEMAPAKAKVVGTGHGLSGNAWAAIVRADRGYPENAIVA